MDHIHADLERRMTEIERDIEEFRRISVPVQLFEERDRRMGDALGALSRDINQVGRAQERFQDGHLADHKTFRNLIASALITALASVVVQLVLFTVSRAR